MDNKKLTKLRKTYHEGFISGSELKRQVIEGCMDKPMADIHKELGDELSLIADGGLRSFIYDLATRLPHYFWHIPASVMGLHDVSSDNMMGGLVRHSKKVARVAQRIGEPYGLDHEADNLIVAGLLHDSFKYGENGFVPRNEDHAIFAANWFEKNNVFNDRPQIRGMIRSHLGRWGRVKPASDLEWAFHLSDFVVSRGASPSLKPARYFVMIPHGRKR